jgi:hypothetical protein
VITILICQDTFTDYKCITECLNYFHEKNEVAANMLNMECYAIRGVW